jgi:MFS family permease
VRAYLTVWRLPSAPVLLLAGFAGRLPSAMVPLALLLMVQQHTGSYAVAGLASAAYGIAMAFMAPILGRRADRHGPRGVLLAEAAIYPLLLAVLTVVVLSGASSGLVFAASAAAGASTPLVSGTVRALWSRVDVRMRGTAYALDATFTELVFVVGPTMVAVVTVLASPAVAIGLAGLLATSGTIGIAMVPVLRRWAPPAGDRPGVFDTVRAAGMPRILASGSALMLGFGALETAIPAFATASGRPGLSGVLLAVWSLGSAAGGLWFGALVLRTSLPRQYRWGLVGVTLGLAPLAAVASPWVLGVLLFLGGTAIAPTLTVQSNLVGAIAPPHATTEAFTWLSTIAFGASAVGAALSGALIDSSLGLAGAFVLAALGAAVAAALAMVPGRRPSAPEVPLVVPEPVAAHALAA